MLRLGTSRIGIAAVGWLWVVGCQAPGPSPLAYSVRRVDLQDPAVVFELAETALTELGYSIDVRDRPSGTLSAVPMDRAPVERRGLRSARLIARRPRRTLASLLVHRSEGAVTVYCAVLIQEQVTESHRMFARDRSGFDTPGETPIERDAATTTRQNTVWRTMRRDKVAERAILSRTVAQAVASVRP